MFTKLSQRSKLTADAQEIKRLALACKLSPTLVSVLAARGLDTEEGINRFLSPSLGDFHDPFLMQGMREVTERLQEAINHGETVVVYGDYDADGICATAIFSKFLSSKGVSVYPYIPSRKSDGYGVTGATLERIIEEALPDLIVTCDCGISAHDEIESVLESGVDIIVTDHHEAPRVLPSCVCIDPKIPDCGYPFDGLCGAGVVLKVIQAMAGLEEVERYLDLAAVATVADLVPLTDENRAIVYSGLARINQGNMNKGLAALLGDMQNVSGTDIAYRVAPRINAAGRMGDAYRAFELLTSDSPKVIVDLVASVDADNVRRKEMCARVYDEAQALVREQDISDTYCLVLGHPDWEKGLTSIVAAQLAGEYNRPTFLVVKNGDCMKGTARSVAGVNLYDVLRECEDLLIEYGGHAQAAGFSIVPEKVEEFRARVDGYLHRNFEKETFINQGIYDLEVSSDVLTFDLARELEKLEPYGNGNPRPVFCVEETAPNLEPMKQKPAHLVLKLGKLNVNAFNHARYASVLSGRGKYRLNIELSVNRFQNRDYLSAVLREFDFDGLGLADAPNPTVDASAYLSVGARTECSPQPIDLAKIEEMVNSSIYGTLFVVYTQSSYARFCREYNGSDRLWHSIFTRETANNYNRIVLAPEPDFDAMGYKNIVLIDGGVNARWLPFAAADAKVFLLDGATLASVDGLTAKREVFVRAFRGFLSAGKGSDLLGALDACRKELSMAQAASCYAVFAALGLVVYDRAAGAISACEGVRRDLTESVGYHFLAGGDGV